MGWGVGGLAPGLERGFPFLPIPPGPCTVSLKKGGQGCSQAAHGSREEHPCAMGGSWELPGTELPLRRIPEQEWDGVGAEMDPAAFLGQHHLRELGMWLSSAQHVRASTRVHIPAEQHRTQQRPPDIPSDLYFHKAAQDPCGISQP